MNARSLSASVAALCACLLSHSARAEELRCDSLARLRGSKSGYQSRGNRCEGLYVSNVGSRSLAAMSFTLGRIRFDLKSPTPARVSAPGQTQSVNIRAVAIPLKTYYRMDATLPADATLLWPLTDVLAPEGLTDSRIGIFGWRGTEENGILVPVRVSQVAPTTSQGPLLTIQASFDAQKVKWRWGVFGEARCSAFGQWQDAIPRPVTAGWPIAIDLSKLPAGTHCFEAVAQSGVSTDWSPLKLRIDIPAQ
ncbi:MAG: hypothetical protein AABO58_18960 [Acidobacteriota bacterium]